MLTPGRVMVGASDGGGDDGYRHGGVIRRGRRAKGFLTRLEIGGQSLPAVAHVENLRQFVDLLGEEVHVSQRRADISQAPPRPGVR